MDELTSILQLLKAQGPLAVILVGAGWLSYKQKWAWGWQLTKVETDCAARVLKAEEETAWWKGVAMQSLGVAETSIHIAKRVDKTNGHP